MAHMSSASTGDTVLVVESPAKAQKIQKYLGSGFQVTTQMVTVATSPLHCEPSVFKVVSW